MSVALLISIICLSASPTTYAYPSSHMLDVPYHAQETDYYCTVAAVQMALQYISNIMISQPELAKEMSTVATTGTRIDMATTPFERRNFTLVQSIHTTLEVLKQQNAQGYVTIINIWADVTHQKGHSVLVIGYNATGLFVNDPWPYNLGFISNDLLANLWSYYQEWALEIPYPNAIPQISLLGGPTITIPYLNVVLDLTPLIIISGIALVVTVLVVRSYQES